MKPGRGFSTGSSVGLARALSKLGFCSRSQAKLLIQAGRVSVNGVFRRDAEFRVDARSDRIAVDNQAVRETAKIYLMLNKPRGLVVTASDEQGRETVFECLKDAHLPFVAPVGRLDKASEGLLLFTNDTRWAAHITDAASHLDKTYHVQIGCLADSALIGRLKQGLQDAGDFLAVKQARLLRQGNRNSWLEIVLDEGKNRHIRRLLEGLNVSVLRLVRTAIGPLGLGNLLKGEFRYLTDVERAELESPAQSGKARDD
jgi:23S rRNA pseudouridine2605 synthase